MKILYLKLVNFANILAAMKTHSVEIDFSKSHNRVVLLMGDNGSGKSSILSQLHPFANTGTGDQRSAKGLMIEGKEAYKEIHIKDGHDIFVIKHFYTKSGSTKSYIAKNNEELNPNGNVTSFLDTVYSELTVTLDYLKLLRLGSNSLTFLRMSATDRKKYTSNLLSDVEIYAKLFKSVNDKVRLLKGLMKNTTDRLNNLRVINRDEIVETLDKLESSLQDLSKRKEEVSIQYGTLLGEQNHLAPDGVESLLDTHRKLNESIIDMTQVLSKAQSITSVEVLQAEKEHLMSEKNILEKKIAEDKAKHDASLNSLSETLDSLVEYQQQMQVMNSSNDIDRLTQTILSLNRERESLDVFEDKELPYTTDEITRALGLMKQIQEVSSLMLGFNEEAKQEVVQMWRDNGYKNPENEIHEMNTEVNLKIQRLKSSALAAQSKSKVEKDKVYFVYKPSGCPGDCPFEDFYNDVTNKDFDSSNTDKTMRKLEKKKDMIDDYFAVNSNINYITMILQANKELIEKVPPEFFDFDSILLGIEKDTVFYDEEYVTTFITISEKLDRYHQLAIMIADMRKELKVIQDNSSSFKLIESEVQKLTSRRDGLEETIELLKNELYYNESTLAHTNDSLDAIERDIQIAKEKDIIKEKHQKLVDESVEVNRKIERLNEVVDLIQQLEYDSQHLSFEIKKTNEMIEQTKRSLIAFDELSEEKAKLEEEFDDLSDTREALSSTKGIPLVYIKLYMADSEAEINELLEIVYGGDLQVQTFNIDENEFTIPYVKNGVLVSDINQCSQGEETFLSLAISFAFSSKSIERYNIMLMDEIDGTLDMKKRMHFLEILETHLDRLGVEQVFLITHNNVFDSYPIDVILTSDVNLDNYRNTNIIFKAS